jgi:mannan endo-1,4-beta-mannosidase
MNVGWQLAINGLHGAGVRVLVFALLTAATAVRAADDPPPTSFVKTSGTAFTIDGRPFFVTGVNNHYLAFGSKNEVTRFLDDAAAMGANGSPIWNVFQAATTRRRTVGQSSNSSRNLRESP